jgi:hypothetical protein
MAAFTKNDSRINRNGRPRKGQSLTEALEKELRKKRETGKTGRAELARVLVDLAINGRDVAALRYIYDRIDGKPVESIDMAAAVNADVGVTQMSREEREAHIKKLLEELGYAHVGTE